MNIYELHKDGYTITTNQAKLDVAAIHKYLSEESYWSIGIPLHIVQKSVANSLSFGVLHNGQLAGFARLVTDKATFAYLADVFILEPHRGKGLSKWLMQAIHAHPDVDGLRRWLLVTKDADTLYEKFGWVPVNEETYSRMMQKHVPDIYQKNSI